MLVLFPGPTGHHLPDWRRVDDFPSSSKSPLHDRRKPMFQKLYLSVVEALLAQWVNVGAGK
jgi:hypothetical protein